VLPTVRHAARPVAILRNCLSEVVGHLEPAVVEKTHQRVLLANAVTERGAQHAALMLHALVLLLDELKERLDVRPEVTIAQRLALVVRTILPDPLELEHAHDACERLARDDVLGREIETTPVTKSVRI
jgi:hypothetical protein